MCIHNVYIPFSCICDRPAGLSSGSSHYRRRAVLLPLESPCREVGKSRRATAVGVDVEEEERVLGDWDNVGDGGSPVAGERSLANLPVEAEPNTLLAAVGCCCSGVVGSDDTPGLLVDGLRMLLSGVCIPNQISIN